MSGIRIGGKGVSGEAGPPFGLLEGAIGGGADQANIWIVDGSGTSVRLTPYTDPTCSSPPCGDEPFTPRINPERTRVATFDFDPDDFAMSLYILPVDGTATYPLATGERLWDDSAAPGGGGYWANHPAWHPDGDRIVFTGDPNGYGGLGGDIIEVTYPGGVATSLWTPNVDGPPQRENGYHPWYSPDGTKIAFIVDLDIGGGGVGANTGLWVMDADGSNLFQVDCWDPTAGHSMLFSGTQLAWSNDSEWIAYIDRGFYGGAGTHSVYKIRPDGTDKTLLAEGDGIAANGYSWRVGWGAWLPDDSAVICSGTNTGSSGWRVFLAPADGSDPNVPPEIVGTGHIAGGQNYETVYRLNTKIYMQAVRSSGGDALIERCDLDGSNIETYFDGTSMDAVIASGTGFEWV